MEKQIVPGGSLSMSEALDDLKAQGYTEDFNTKEYLENHFDSQKHLDNFKIDKIIRMDVMTDPGDQSVIYAISSKDESVKGVIVNSYGLYSDTKLDDIVDHMARPIDRNRHDIVDYV
jgi:hypothetical protein